MPIPDFNQNGVIPPYKGSPTLMADLSPFSTTTFELCRRFATSAQRRSIITGFLNYRNALRNLGITVGFQWIDGSFTEDVERLRGRPPSDMDVVTFFSSPLQLPSDAELNPIFAVLTNEAATKEKFHVHHQLVNLGWEAQQIIEHTRFWCGLFSHQRDTEVWKGMLHIDLSTPTEDSAAVQYLASLEQS